MKLGVATSRPHQVVGVHFFNPVPVLQLVELVPSLLTAADTVERCRTWVEGLGKRPIDCQDRAGFVVSDLAKRLRAVVPYQGKSEVAFLCHDASDGC